MKMNVEESEVMRMARQPSPVQIMIDKKNSWRMQNIYNIWVP
jgi:hypothetical protein